MSYAEFPLRLINSFATILKWNPNHYGAGEHGGQFESKDDYDDYEEKFTPKKARQYTSDPKDLNEVFTRFKNDGCTLDEEPAEMAKRWAKIAPNVHPHEFFRAFLGPKGLNDTNMYHIFLSVDAVNKKISFSSTGDGLTVHGAKVKDYEREVDIGNHGVQHSRLEIIDAKQGSGVVKDLFKSCIPLYEKMGLSHITLYANLDRGAYAWGKYGFKYHDEGNHANKERHQREITHRLGLFKAHKLGADLSTEAKKECDAITKVLKSKKDDSVWALTDMKTPHLDKAYAALVKKDSDKSNFVKLLMKKTNWPGVMDIQKGSPSRARLDQYLGSKK